MKKQKPSVHQKLEIGIKMNYYFENKKLRASKAIREPIRFIKKNLKKDLIGVEVGVRAGDHAKQMLNYLSLKKLYLIDIWEEKWTVKVRNDCYIKEETKPKDLYFKVVERLSKYSKNSNIEFIKEESMKAVKRFRDKSLDFVYIDANHSYEFVLEDLHAWEKKIKIDGVICGHDYKLFGVRKAIETYLETHPRNLQIYDSIRGDWWWTVPNIIEKRDY